MGGGPGTGSGAERECGTERGRAARCGVGRVTGAEAGRRACDRSRSRSRSRSRVWRLDGRMRPGGGRTQACRAGMAGAGAASGRSCVGPEPRRAGAASGRRCVGRLDGRMRPGGGRTQACRAGMAGAGAASAEKRLRIFPAKNIFVPLPGIRRTAAATGPAARSGMRGTTAAAPPGIRTENAQKTETDTR